ncbi:MAG: GTP cyclohydrolase II, partial [Cyanobacteriota bacterium]|nr:GTP cyclohydrolase II [Cyanobacteriota bacterium]
IKGDPAEFKDQPVMVRVHSECLTGDAFGSLRCDCRMQLQAALKMIEGAGAGVVVYLRQEGRGIGLINKLKAYSLQDLGLDTVEANERLGFPADLRNYGLGAQILNDIGVNKICLITNNPRKIAGLKGYRIEIVDRMPLLIEATDYNSGYLATKAKKLGHLLLQTYLVTVAIQWDEARVTLGGEDLSLEAPSTPAVLKSAAQLHEKSDRLEKLKTLARSHDLLLQEERRPLAIALFHRASLTFHLGIDQVDAASEDWYQQSDHPYIEAIAKILDQILTAPGLKKLEFLVSPGVDPLANLQIQLQRKTFPLTQFPSSICDQLEPQTIYSFS